MFAVLVLAIGLRHEVGGDWFNYEPYIYAAADNTLLQSIALGDPAYSALNWVAAHVGGGIYFVNTVCAIIFTTGLLVFCRAQPRPWLAMVVAMPYLVIVVAMGYTRQAVAIGLAMLALVSLSDQRNLRFVLFIVMAATFHKSAVILMPLAVLANSKRRLLTAIWIGITSILFYLLLLQDSIEAFSRNYIDAEFKSSGAAIRIAMNAVPASIFLLFRHRFVMSSNDRSFWTWLAMTALIFIGVLLISPSSTAVDRMALYWIPLQLFVLSRLPNALGLPAGSNDLWVCSIVAYCATVLGTWLFYADNAFAWLPYQFYPWYLLWR